MDPGRFLQGRTRETRIRRTAEGRWFNDDVEIRHPNLVKAFDAWLQPAPDDTGRWCLSNDINWAYVAIEGAPRFVRRATVDEDGRLRLTFSSGHEAPLVASTLREGPDGALYCDGPDGLTARFDRHVLPMLADQVGEDEAGLYLLVEGERVRPRRVVDPLER